MKTTIKAGTSTLALVSLLGVAAVNAAPVTVQVEGSVDSLVAWNAFGGADLGLPGGATWTVAPGVIPPGGAPADPASGTPDQGEGRFLVQGTITFDDADPNNTVTALNLSQVGTFSRFVNGATQANPTPVKFSTSDYFTYSGISWTLGSDVDTAGVSGSGQSLVQTAATVTCDSSGSGCGPSTGYAGASINSNGGDGNQSILSFRGHPESFDLNFGSVDVPGAGGVTFGFTGTGVGDTVNLDLRSITGATAPLFYTVGQGSMSLSIVPIPAAVWMFMSALGMLGAARRRTVKSAS